MYVYRLNIRYQSIRFRSAPKAFLLVLKNIAIHQSREFGPGSLLSKSSTRRRCIRVITLYTFALLEVQFYDRMPYFVSGKFIRKSRPIAARHFLQTSYGIYKNFTINILLNEIGRCDPYCVSLFLSLVYFKLQFAYSEKMQQPVREYIAI